MDASERLKPGDRVAIPVTTKTGAFLSERFISLESLHGPVSGFVHADEIFDVEGDRGFIRGLIEEIRDDAILVRISGSFFTTTGLATLSKEWANRNLSTD